MIATTVEGLAGVAAGVVVLALAGGALAGLVAAGYRLYARERIPDGLAVLVSLATVSLYLNTDDALRQAMGQERGVFDLTVALATVLTFLAAGLAAPPAARAGDRLAGSLSVAGGAREVEGGLSRLVRTVGRVITVDLPEEVDDMEAYDPVADERKAAIAGRTLVFPRGLTVAELRERLVDRLESDYGVGHVDVDLADDGTVEYLAVGSRAAGIGPTLPPRTVAVAVRADPAFSGGPGDTVQVWRPGDPPERVCTAELRGTAGDVVTLALDESEAAGLDGAVRYRLVTLPASPRPENEFAALLRGADETMGVTTVRAGSELAGSTVGDVGTTVVAVRTADGGIEPIPRRGRPLAAEEVVYAIGRPEALRAVERRAAAPG